MPLCKIYHTTGTFPDNAAKEALSNDLTNFYTIHTGMPAFYVGVIFIPLADSTLFVGGKARGADSPFVRLEVDQIHIRLPDEDAAHARSREAMCEMLAPHLGAYGWEIHVDETDRRLWAIDGIAPPEWRSEEEARWREAGKPLARV